MSYLATYSGFLTRLFLTACLSWDAHTVAHAQALESQAVFDVGDKSTYRFHNKGDRKEPHLFTDQAYKSEAGSGWLYGESKDPAARRKQYIWRYDYKRGDAKEGFEFNPRNPTEPGDRFSNRQPMDDRIQFPLTIGKRFSVREDWPNGQGYTEYKGEVEALEKIKTEAGEFEAYRIKLAGWWNRTSNGSGSGRAQFTRWFAPAVKRVVNAEFFELQSNDSPWTQESTELVKWEPKAALTSVLGPPAPSPAVAPSAATSAPQ